jgi:hypothetical protein
MFVLLPVSSQAAGTSHGKHSGHKHAADKKEAHEHGAHEHGHGSLNIAVDGNRIEMELVAPGADIVGFERQPENDADRASVEDAKTKLAAIGNVVSMPSAAGCKLDSSNVELHVEAGATHTEFHAGYKLTCAAPKKLTELTFVYFKNYKGARELEVNIIGPKGQKQFEVKRSKRKLKLKGAI